MDIDMTYEEGRVCRGVAKELFVRGQLGEPTASALIKEALARYLDVLGVGRDVFKSGARDCPVSSWPTYFAMPPRD